MSRCFGAADPVGNIAASHLSPAECSTGKWDSSDARGYQNLWRVEENGLASSENNRIRLMVSFMYTDASKLELG